MSGWMEYFIRFGLYTALTMCFGGSFFLSTYFEEIKGSQYGLSIKKIFPFFCVLAFIFSALQIVFLTEAMEDVSLSEVSLKGILFLMQQGSYDILFTLRFVALLAVLFLSVRKPPSKMNWLACTYLSGIALMTEAWFGHAVSDDVGMGWLHLVADVAHILTAGVWGGSLLAFCWLLFGSKEAVISEKVLRKFSCIGYAVVTILLMTGVVNTYFIVGSDLKDYTHPSSYVVLIYTKIIVFVAMLLLASFNHFVFTPRLGQRLRDNVSAVKAVQRLRMSIVLEYTLYLVIIGLVAVVGVQSPTPDM
ncbi:copper resistance protein D [Neokomagataea tanensis NBRC 106556]|uniref:Copper resistance protein D n=3 Tax=Neokomagataea TaxID=1223423 RepID=A0ABQ0QLB5_9PROT|nr:copper homeostasis membrane protein CopD [Neokomagataea tanensis]GBR49171.1 copper resistance protein D [Neokomagataea tanensis NBRC 106556]